MLWLLSHFYYLQRSWSLPLENMEFDWLVIFLMAISMFDAFKQYQYNKTNLYILNKECPKPMCWSIQAGKCYCLMCFLWHWSCNNWVNQPNKLLSAKVSLLFYLILNILEWNQSTKFLHLHICNLGNKKSIKSKNFPAFKGYETSTNNFMLIPCVTPKLLGQKNVKIYYYVKILHYVKLFLQHSFYSLINVYWI